MKAYCVLFLLLETGMLGVFCALDFFLFYVFWEVMLLPMYFLIGIWGGPRKEYAAIKFFLYTLVGSVLMLIAILMLYFNSDLRQLPADQIRGHRRRQPAARRGGAANRECRRSSASDTPQHTFNILAMQQMGQHTDLFTERDAVAAIRCSGGRSCCCSSASPSRCPACRCTRGCPTRTSKRRRRSR